MPSGPVKDVRQPPARLIRIGVQPRRKFPRFVRTEVGEVDPPADVEGRTCWVLDELVRRRHAEQHEGQTLKRVFRSPSVETGSERRKKVVREGLADGRVDFVHENHDPTIAICQDQLAEEIGETLNRRQIGPLLPP